MGGSTSYMLDTAGVKVLCLDRWRMLDPSVDFYMIKLRYEWPYCGGGKPGQYGKFPQGMAGKINEWMDHLYTNPSEDPYVLAPGPEFT